MFVLLLSLFHSSVASNNQELVQDPPPISHPRPEGDDVFIHECPGSINDDLKKLDKCLNDLQDPKFTNPLDFIRNYTEFLKRKSNDPQLQTDASNIGCEDEEEAEEMFRDLPVNITIWKPDKGLLDIRPKCSTPQFRIRNKSFMCPHNKLEEGFHWHPRWADKMKVRNCPIPTTELLLANMSIFQDGNLVWNKQEGQRHVYSREDYCISRHDKGEWVSFKVCTSNCSDVSSPCVRKCCPPSKVIDADSKRCIDASPYWRPIFYRSAGEQEKNSELVAPNASIIFGFPNCPKKYKINESPTNNFKLLLNGKLALISGSKRNYINVGEFCIDGIYYGSKNDQRRGSGKLEVVYSRSEWDQVVIACKPSTREIDKWRIPTYATLNCISALFLLLTDVVYLLLWRQQNIHGWLQFSYSTSLLCTFICFVVVQWWSEQLLAISDNLCKIMGWITHLTYLSAFFWLTSMNFDLWWRFSRPLKSIRLRPQEKKWKRFMGFAAFSIGIPLIISGIGISLDYKYGKWLLEPPLIIPGFGKEKCYFESKRSQIPYLYGPAGVLLLIDLIFFASTVLNLRKMHAHTELARTQSTAAMEDKKGLRVIAKLVIVMGVLWVFELGSWIAQVVLPDQEIVTWIFMPADMLISLHGVAIFFIFVCKPNIGNQLLAIFKKDEATNAWNKQIQLPSVTTIQQPIKLNESSGVKAGFAM